MHVGLLRAVGAATAVYGLVLTARPDLLARPSGLVDDEGRTAPATRTALRPLAWRDAASGLALLCAPREGAALRTAALVRIAADFGDAALLSVTLPGRGRRRAAVAVSLGWGALSTAALLVRDRGRDNRQEEDDREQNDREQNDRKENNRRPANRRQADRAPGDRAPGDPT